MNIFNPKSKFQTWLFPMQFACFNCRKVYKRTIDYDRYEKTQICPQGAEEMILMGRAFKAPKQNNLNQWKKVEHLVRSGFRFHNNALCYIAPRPSLTTLREAHSFTEGRKSSSLKKRRLKTIFKK